MTKEMLKSNQHQEQNRSSSKTTLFSLACALLMPTLGVSITNVALPDLANSFNASISSVSWVVISYLVSVVTFIMGAAVFGDIFGRKPLLLLGIGFFSVASLICAISVNLWMLVAARMIQGLGAALILSQTLALASSAQPKSKIGSAMGFLSTTAAIGTALGPVVGGFLLEIFGWQSIFWTMFGLGCVSFSLNSHFIPNALHKLSGGYKDYDFIGTLLLGLACLLYALSVTQHSPMLKTSSIMLLAAAALVFTLFLIRQHSCKTPLIKLTFFHNKLRNVTLAANFFVDLVAMSTLVIGPYFLTYRFGLSGLDLGILMAVGPFLSACSGYPAGKLVDLIGAKRVMYLGLSCMFIGILCFAFLPILFGLAGYIAALFVLTPGRQMFLTSNHSYIMSGAAQNEKGLASGVLNLVKNLGLMTGASMMVRVFASQLPTENIRVATRQELEAAFTSTFVLASAFIGVLLLCVYWVSARSNKFE